MTYAELFDIDSDIDSDVDVDLDIDIDSDVDFDLPFLQKVKAAINYWRFAFCTKDRSVKISSWGKLMAPLGWLMHVRDRGLIS